MKYFRRFFIITVTIFIVFLLYLEFGGMFILKTNDKRTITFNIRSSEKIPNNFSNFYNTVYPNSLSENSWNYMSGIFTNSDSPRKECPCNQMSYKILPTLEIKHTKRINYFMNQFIVARFIENKFSQKECLQFNFGSFDFLENRKGLSEVSHSLFKKDAKDLKPMEMAEILALYEAPLKYNRSRNPQKAKERTEHFYHVYLNNSKIKN